MTHCPRWVLSHSPRSVRRHPRRTPQRYPHRRRTRRRHRPHPHTHPRAMQRHQGPRRGLDRRNLTVRRMCRARGPVHCCQDLLLVRYVLGRAHCWRMDASPAPSQGRSSRRGRCGQSLGRARWGPIRSPSKAHCQQMCDCLCLLSEMRLFGACTTGCCLREAVAHQTVASPSPYQTCVDRETLLRRSTRLTGRLQALRLPQG
jgi:hypothetical protein